MRGFGREYVDDASDRVMGGSTDMGNVTYEVPGFHCAFTVGNDDARIQPHTPAFAAAAGTKPALERALDCGKGMAATAYALLTQSELMEEVWKNFREEMKPESKL